MAFRYDNTNDCQQQLDGCVMMSKQGAVRLRYSRGWDWEVFSLTTGKKEIGDIRKAGITFAPLELGYVNHPEVLAYLIRNPLRMWKQGISFDNIKAVSGFLPDDLLRHKSMGRTLANDYPSVNEALSASLDTGGGTAFHRDFAFSTHAYPKLHLEYKGSVIGEVNDNKDFEINEKYIYVKEILEEILHG